MNTLIIGKSGSGKSKSIEYLDAKKTFIINVNHKPLPFRGWKSKYSIVTKDNGTGNMMEIDDPDSIIKTVDYVNKNRTEIEIGIIDDFQYIMANEFMRRAKEKGYEKFTEIGEHAWRIIWNCQLCRPNLTWFFLAHSDENDQGETKCKTIGRMLDDKICLEGMFTIVLNTHVEVLEDKRSYFFETQTNGKNTSKSPDGMFNSYKIPNDLKLVYDSIQTYERG